VNKIGGQQSFNLLLHHKLVLVGEVFLRVEKQIHRFIRVDNKNIYVFFSDFTFDFKKKFLILKSPYPGVFLFSEKNSIDARFLPMLPIRSNKKAGKNSILDLLDYVLF